MERADLEQWKAREVARLLALVETERRYYQEIVASIPVGLLVLSSDLAIISANRAIRKIFGLRSGDSLRGRLDSLLPGWVLDHVTEVLETGVAETDILVETERDGKRVRLGIQAIRNWDDESSQEALLTIEDLSGIEIAPQPQAPATEPQGFPASELIDNLDAIVWAVELPSMNFLFVSKHAEKVLGYSPDQWTSNPSFWTDRVHAADRDWVTQSYRRAMERGGDHACEFRAVTADGRLVWLRENARLLKDAEGGPAYFIGVTVDVTQRRELEDQLVQSERVEAVNRLASRMAHDLNNMLMILTGYSEELLSGIPAGSSLRGDVQEILAATGRMNGLTTQLLAFTRHQGNAANTVSLETVLNGTKNRLLYLAGAGLHLDFKSSSDAGEVKADAAQLEQVLTSIVERARQSMHGEGRIAIETSQVEITEDLRRADAPLRPGSYAVITIANTGRPLEGEARATLFETILAGKDAMDETAGALSRAYGIVRQWGGDISVSNGPAEGSVFRVFLESVAANIGRPREPVELVPEVVAPQEETRLETILVVEDEAGIRALVRKILRRQGYEVLEASNGDEALIVCQQHAGTLDLLITDVMMPQMGGRELVDRMREQCSGMKVLYVSGYTDDPSIYSGNFPPGTAFLQKPFTLGSLLDKVKEVLAM
jgi:two-component system cell cycle sensor histidine kinase/response regulator CckA